MDLKQSVKNSNPAVVFENAKELEAGQNDASVESDWVKEIRIPKNQNLILTYLD